jgi:hypothetical protein
VETRLLASEDKDLPSKVSVAANEYLMAFTRVINLDDYCKHGGTIVTHGIFL